jgi:hypothetical protein
MPRLAAAVVLHELYDEDVLPLRYMVADTGVRHE